MTPKTIEDKNVFSIDSLKLPYRMNLVVSGL